MVQIVLCALSAVSLSTSLDDPKESVYEALWALINVEQDWRLARNLLDDERSRYPWDSLLAMHHATVLTIEALFGDPVLAEALRHARRAQALLEQERDSASRALIREELARFVSVFLILLGPQIQDHPAAESLREELETLIQDTAWDLRTPGLAQAVQSSYAAWHDDPVNSVPSLTCGDTSVSVWSFVPVLLSGQTLSDQEIDCMLQQGQTMANNPWPHRIMDRYMMIWSLQQLETRNLRGAPEASQIREALSAPLALLPATLEVETR